MADTKNDGYAIQCRDTHHQLPSQKDIYSTSIDYDVTAQATKRFFATVQNKLHWTIHGQTAAEVIVSRADHQKENMGLTIWTDAPKGKIQKFDVSVAKNYLSDKEIQQLQRLVSAYLDIAEDMTMSQMPVIISKKSR